MALIGGFVFKGRSGWCGTFCPLGPIQRTFGQAPLVVVRNGFCKTCVGCQKNCYDFNPRGAIFSDVYDEDPRFAWQRRLFMGLLPGLVLGYFGQGPAPAYGEAWYLLILFGACCASAGLFALAVSFLPVSPYKISVLFGAFAFGAFYWFSGPTMVRAIADLVSLQPPALALAIASRSGSPALWRCSAAGCIAKAGTSALCAPRKRLSLTAGRRRCQQGRHRPTDGK